MERWLEAAMIIVGFGLGMMIGQPVKALLLGLF